ncbi:hypothetical protein FACS1894200_10340 [Spirochaetia bacterium]|nr:hypothetical protein FACS1894200_10340 [Spirochaetia bacterium]
MKASTLRMLTFAVSWALAACASGPVEVPRDNNIGEIIGDDFAVVRAPWVQEFANTDPAGFIMTTLAGQDITVPGRFHVTKSSIPFFASTYTRDIRVPSGTHEYTLIYIGEDRTLILTESFDFQAGKWYTFSRGLLKDTVTEGSLKEGKIDGKAEEVATFKMEQVYNSDEVLPPPPQVTYQGSPGKTDKPNVSVFLGDPPDPGQVVVALSDGFKFGPGATAERIVKNWLAYPTYPITVSPAHCIGEFSPDGTKLLITMRTSANRTVTSGNVEMSSFISSDLGTYFLPKPENAIDEKTGKPIPSSEVHYGRGFRVSLK